MATILEPSEMRHALRALRTRRRVQRLRNLDWVDTLYRAYIVGISLVAALATLAAIVGDAPVGAATIHDIRRAGPAVAGFLVALLMAIGLRSGSHGGPLAFEAADVHHVFLAPVDRGFVVRSAAVRQLRGVISAGALAGALAGVVAGPRLGVGGGDTAAWVASGVGFGLAAALAAWGSALIASAGRVTQPVTLAVGGLLVVWSGADLLMHTTTSPLTMLGHLAVWPLDRTGLAFAGVAFVGIVVAVGLAAARRLSLEPVLHRAQLVRALRFAATIQDLRAVITLRRQLAHEQSRRRPWLVLRTGSATGGGNGVGRAGWRRDWQGILRWPGARISRVFGLTLIGGASCAGALRGTTPLLAVAAVATYVIALDTVEGLAQELDHPDRGSGIPLEPGALYLAHLTVPMVFTGVVALLGFGTGALVAAFVPAASGVASVSPVAGLAVVVAITVTAPTAAALSVYLGRPERDFSMVMLHPGVVVAQQVAPLVIVALAFVPLIVAREVRAPTDPTVAALASAGPALAIAFAIRAFLRSKRTGIG